MEEINEKIKSLEVDSSKKEIEQLTEKIKNIKVETKQKNNTYDEWCRRMGYPTLAEQIKENEN